MKIRIFPDRPNLPIGPAMGRVGSAMPLAIVGVPSGATAVSVTVFNADGTASTASATKQDGEWLAVVPASHFASYGAISRGLQVAVTFRDATETLQTVLFLGDVRIDSSAASDPSGTGAASVPVTPVDDVPDGSSMKDIRDKVNEIARIVSGTATALMLAFCAFGASPLEEIPGTNLVYTAAETDAAIVRLAPPGITTNDVCNIVTNTITGFTDWTFSPATNIEEGIARYNFGYEGGNQWMLEAYAENGDAVFILSADGGPDATSLTFFGSSYTATRTFMPPRNALGLASLDDLPPLTNSLPTSFARIARDATNYTDAAIAALPTGGLTTNEVCNIVTNDVTAGYTDWVCNPAMIGDERVYIEWDSENWIPTNGDGKSGVVNGNATSTNLAWEANDWWGGVPLTATRTPITRNSLGLARLADLPPLTNGIPEAVAQNATDISANATAIAAKADKGDAFYALSAPSISLSANVLTYTASTNASQYVEMLTGTNVLYIVVPPAIGGKARDFALTVANASDVAVRLDSSVEWHFDTASTNLTAGWTRLYCTEAPTNTFSLQSWTPDDSQAVQ